MPAIAVIHLNRLKKNIEAARKIIGPHPKICLPVKADAYGHGAVPVSQAALKAGVEYLAVAGAAEGRELREAGIKAPILLLSQALPEELKEIICNELTPLVSDNDFIEEAALAAQRENKSLGLHLKVDTGMGRLGCRPEEAVKLAAKICSLKKLKLEGIATHFSVSDSKDNGSTGADSDFSYTKDQIRKFKDAVNSIRKAGIEPGIVHAANSGALVLHNDSYFDMVRPGLFLYGYSFPENLPQEAEIEPVMELKSVLVSIKKVKKGEYVSYGRSWTAKRDTFIGIIPTGYADGFPRALSNNHSILIRGRAYPLTGRICMDQCMVDLGTEPEVKRWDEATIFGPGFINAKDIADKINTIPYEITCNINKRVVREYRE